MNLETLYIEVKLQTEEVKKGVEQAQSQVKRLEDEFHNLSKAGDSVSSSFHGIAQSVVGMFAGFVGLHTILSGANGAIQGIRDIGAASRELNVDVTALDAWGHAVQRTGGTAQQFQGSLKSLADHFGTTGEVALRVLPRLADLFQRLNPRQAQLYGKSLGLDLPTILLLQQGRREVEAVVAQQQKLGLVTKEQTEITRKFDNALYDASRAYQTFYRELALPLLPGITEGINYFIEHKNVVKDSFKAMALGVTALTVALVRLGGPITKAVAAITALGAAYGLIKEDIEFLLDPSKNSLLEVAYGNNPQNPNATKQQKKDYAVTTGIPSLFLDPFSQLALRSGGFQDQKTEVNIEKVEINTAATDAEGIAAAAKGSLQQQLSQLTSHVDNGVHS
jgi:hypothetical protein